MEKILNQILDKIALLGSTMDQRFEQIDQRFESMDQRFEQIDQRFESMDQRFDRLEKLTEESHQWIKVLVENKEIQKAEMDRLTHRVSTVEGVLTGFEKSLEGMKKAQ